MKLPVFKNCFLLLLLLMSQHSHAQLDIDAHLRSRAEIRDGYQRLAVKDFDPAFLVSQRTRLSFSYSNPLLKLKFTPQDVRLWGDQPKMSSGVGDNPSLDLFEACFELRLFNSAWITAGRQQLVYDSRRLLGDRNWSQNGISYDALVVKLAAGMFNLHAGTSWNTQTEALSGNFYPSSRIKSLNFIWLNRKFNNSLSLSFMHISSGITQTDTTNDLNFRHTTGVYGEIKRETLRAWGNLFYQYGKSQKGNTVSAFLLDAEISFITSRLTPGIGISYLSGNRHIPSGNDTDHLFDVLYGNRHRYFGFMDYFRSFEKDTKNGGLADYFGWLDYRFNSKLSARNTLHAFYLAETNNETPGYGKLGFENDLILKYKIAEWGELEGGYCFFLPTASLREIQDVQNDKFSQFIYLQLTLTPNLFSQSTNSK
jgi:hypothetical protein